MESIPRIGLALWEGSFLPKYAMDILSNNAMVFDTIYLVTNVYGHGTKVGNIVCLDSNIYRRYIESKTYTGIDAAALSDYISYMPKDVLSLYDIEVEKVMVFDTDYLIYNKLMITRLFDNQKSSFISVEKSTYPNNYGELFYNPCMTFVVDDMSDLGELWIDTVVKDKTYGSGSSRMLMKVLSTIKLAFSKGLDSSRYLMPHGYHTDSYRSYNSKYLNTNSYTIGVHIECSTYYRYLLYNEDENNDLRIQYDLNEGGRYIITPCKSEKRSNMRFELND